MMLEDEDIDAVVNLSGEKPVIIDCVKVARVTVPVRRAVLTPTILETELGFFRKLIVNKIYCTDLEVARVIVATFEAKEQLDIVTPVVYYVLKVMRKNETYTVANSGGRSVPSSSGVRRQSNLKDIGIVVYKTTGQSDCSCDYTLDSDCCHRRIDEIRCGLHRDLSR
jgi:hypothetical protein